MGQRPTPELPDPDSQESDPRAKEVMELDKGSGPELDPATDWREPYLKWLLHGELPADRMEA